MHYAYAIRTTYVTATEAAFDRIIGRTRTDKRKYLLRSAPYPLMWASRSMSLFSSMFDHRIHQMTSLCRQCILQTEQKVHDDILQTAFLSLTTTRLQLGSLVEKRLHGSIDRLRRRCRCPTIHDVAILVDQKLFKVPL